MTQRKNMASKARISSKTTQDRLVQDLVKTGKWTTLVSCLQQHSLTDTQLGWAIQKASERATEEELLCLIPHVPARLLHPVLTEAVKRGLWNGVVALLGRGVTQEQRQWAVSAACKRASGSALESIVLMCRGQPALLDCALPGLVQRRQWGTLKRLMPDHLTDVQQNFVVREASRHAEQADLGCFLPHCADSQLDLVMAEVVKRKMWMAVSDLLKRPVSEKLKKQTVREALKEADENAFSSIVQHCSDDQTDLALKEAVHRRLWGIAEKLLWRGVEDELLQWTLVQAAKYSHEVLLCRLIEEFSDDLTAGPMLTELVRGRRWEHVAELMKYRIPDDRRKWIFEEAFKHASGEQIMPLISHCSEDLLVPVLRQTVERRLWECVTELLRRSRLSSSVTNSHDLSSLSTESSETPSETLDTLISWAVVEASKHASSNHLRPLLRFCTSQNFEAVLTQTLRRRFWRLTHQLLQNHKDSDYFHTTLENVSVSLKDEGDAFVKEALDFLAWGVVNILLKYWRVSRETKRMAVRRLCRSGFFHMDDSKEDFASIIQHCDNSLLFLAFEAAVRRNLPDIASDILDRIGQLCEPGQARNTGSQNTIACDNEQQDNDTARASHSSQIQAMTKASKSVPFRNGLNVFCHCSVNLDNSNPGDVYCDAGSSNFDGTCHDNCYQGNNDSSHGDPGNPYNKERENFELYSTALDNNGSHFCTAGDTDNSDTNNSSLSNSDLENDREHDNLCADDSDSFTSKAGESGSSELESNDGDTNHKRSFRKHPYLHRRTALRSEGQRPGDQKSEGHKSTGQRCKVQRSSVHEPAMSASPTSTKLARACKTADLLSVTHDGRTVMSIAMEIKQGHHDLLSQCVELGVSTHQPTVTDDQSLKGCDSDSPLYRHEIFAYFYSNSPFKRAVVTRDLEAVQMLYESGSCSNKELFEVYRNISTWCEQSRKCRAMFGNISAYLKDNAKAPRRLTSICRLSISHHLGVGCRRQEAAEQLPLPDKLRNYVLFSDVLKARVGAISGVDVISQDEVAAANSTADDAMSSQSARNAHDVRSNDHVPSSAETYSLNEIAHDLIDYFSWQCVSWD